jgi:hypothetical protein
MTGLPVWHTHTNEAQHAQHDNVMWELDERMADGAVRSKPKRDQISISWPNREQLFELWSRTLRRARLQLCCGDSRWSVWGHEGLQKPHPLSAFEGHFLHFLGQGDKGQRKARRVAAATNVGNSENTPGQDRRQGTYLHTVQLTASSSGLFQYCCPFFNASASVASFNEQCKRSPNEMQDISKTSGWLEAPLRPCSSCPADAFGSPGADEYLRLGPRGARDLGRVRYTTPPSAHTHNASTGTPCCNHYSDSAGTCLTTHVESWGSRRR